MKYTKLMTPQQLQFKTKAHVETTHQRSKSFRGKTTTIATNTSPPLFLTVTHKLLVMMCFIITNTSQKLNL